MAIQNKLSIFLYLSIIVFGQSCKLNSSENDELNKNVNVSTKPRKLSLYEIETQNGKLIDSIEKRIIKQIKEKDFSNLYKEADTSLKNTIGLEDIQGYFYMINKFYGNLDKLSVYGTMATENSKSLDYIANYSKGDSLELHFNLRFYNHDAKLSYITMNRFKNDVIPESIKKTFKPKVETIFKKEYLKVYSNCTQKYKANISFEELTKLIDKHLKTNKISYELKNCKPLIFGKGEIGFLAETEITLENKKIKKSKIKFLLNSKNDFEFADIQFSK